MILSITGTKLKEPYVKFTFNSENWTLIDANTASKPNMNKARISSFLLTLSDWSITKIPQFSLYWFLL